MLVLVVDDYPDIAMAVKAMLEIHEFQADVVSDGHEALEYLREKRPGMMVVDLMMPGITGIELLKIVKADPELAHITFVLYTAHNSPRVKEEALRLGACEVILKSNDTLQDIVAAAQKCRPGSGPTA